MRRLERISPSFVSLASKSSPLFPFHKVTCTLVSNRPFLTHSMHLSGPGDRLMEDTQGAPPRGCTFSFSWQGMVSRAPSLMIDYQPLSTTVSSALWIKKKQKKQCTFTLLYFLYLYVVTDKNQFFHLRCLIFLLHEQDTSPLDKYFCFGASA